MPPIRRRNPTPPVKARRPKVAGSTGRLTAETGAEAVDDPTAATDTGATEHAAVVEKKAEPAEKKSAVGETEPVDTTAAPADEVETVEKVASDEVTAPAEPEESVAGAGQDAVTATKARRKILPARRPPAKPRQLDDAEVDAPEAAGRSRISWKMVATLGAIAALLGVFALVAVFKPGAQVSNPAWVDTAETQEVSSAARSAIETLYTYKVETVDQDFDKARAVLNKSMLDDFNRTADTTKTAVVQTKTATQAEVTDVGVKVLSDDRAELVASMTVSASNDGVAQGSAQGPLSITMEKVDGKWLLSKIEDQ